VGSRDLAAALWRRKFYGLAVFALWLGAGAVYASTQATQYQASARLQIQPAHEMPAGGYRTYVAVLMGIYGHVSGGQRFADTVTKNSGFRQAKTQRVTNAISLNPDPLSGEMTVTARWPTQAGAVRIATIAASQLAAIPLIAHHLTKPKAVLLVEPTMLDRSAVAQGKVGPSPRVYWAAWLLAGVVLGLAAALAADRLSDKVFDPESVVSAGLPLAGVLPFLPNDRRPIAASVDDDLARVFAVLRTDVLYRLDARHARSIAVIGLSSKSRGSLVAANLAVAIAQVETDVLLVDANPEGFSLAELFDLNEAPSPADSSPDQRDPDDLVSPSGIANLSVVPLASQSADAPPVPGEIAARIPDVVGRARTTVVDAPSIEGIHDGRLAAAFVDAVLLVVRAGEARTSNLQAAAASLEGMPGRLLGVVLVDASRAAAHRGASAVAPAGATESIVRRAVPDAN
jgi:Mrp family chromosome partitioning ATPase